MKKVIIYTCIGFIVMLSSIVILRQKKTTTYVVKRETHTVTDSSEVKGMPVLKFAETRNDFGTVRPKGASIDIVFEFQNTGDVPLLIQKVDVSCGCLSVEFPKEPTASGRKGSIKVTIDTKDFTGAFNKTLFVKSNATEDVILLRILGQIK